MYYLETSVLGFASLLILLVALLLGMLLYKDCMENGSGISVEVWKELNIQGKFILKE